MSTTPPPPAAVSNTYRFPLFFALIVAGLAGNYFKYPIFLNIDFLFGSIFAMLTLQFFGLSRGIVAAAAIASYTYVLWNHPYAIIIMTAEVLVVGWLMTRRKTSMVLADTLYWVIIGMPLVYLFYHVAMHVPPNNTYIVMAKQAMNGISNALVARMIFSAYAHRSRSEHISYSEIIYNLLAFFVLFPSLVLLVVSSRTDFIETDKSIKNSLNHSSQQINHSIETWLLNRKSAIVNLAEMAALRSPRQMQPYLELTKNSDVNYLRVGLLDKEATITAYAPLVDELGVSSIGINAADRPYLSILKKTLKPMFSEVVMGRVGTPKPRVFMLAPVIIGGNYGGYVIGVLNLEQIRAQLVKGSARNDILYTLLDKSGHIIMTNRTDQKIMSPLERGKGTLNRLDKAVSQWVPALPSNTPTSERWKKSFYITETVIGELAEWKLVLEQPVAPFQRKLYDRYTGKLTLLLLILLGSLTLAEFLSRRSIALLQKSEIRFRSMFTNHTAIMLLIEPVSGKIIDANLAAEQFYGYPRTKLHAMNISDINGLSPEQLQAERPLALNGQRNYFIFPHRLADGEIRTVEIHSTPITVSDIILLFSIVHDITERRLAEDELHQARELSESANLAKSRFLSIVAHEFRTPLGLLTVSADILSKYRHHLPLEEQLEQYDQIRDAAAQMSTLVDSVSAYNQQERGAYTFYPVRVDIKPFCDTIASAVYKVWNNRHEFNVSIFPDCGASDLDETLFRRLLENLLSNAFRFTPAGGTVSLSVSRLTATLLIEVTDTGIGIPKDDQARIYEAFYRSSNVDARKGLGLGLSIVSDAVRQMNGSISVTSNIGEGSIFRAELPLSNETVTEEQQS